MARYTVDIKAGRLFPYPFLVLAGILLAAGLVVIANYPLTAALLSLLSLSILTAYEGTEVDPEARTIREYYAFLFMKTGSASKYKSLAGITIHSAKVSQRMFTAHTMSSRSFTHVKYNAYLKLDNGEKILLFSGRKKGKILQRATELGRFLNTSVTDHAVGR